MTREAADAGLLITPEALAADRAAIVFDCRFSLTNGEAGRLAYEADHIPEARYIDLERDLSAAPGAGGRHPLPDREALADRLRDCGVDNTSLIVCYDGSSGATACRFWWLVRWLGHADVRVLDGGLEAWIAAGFATDSRRVMPRRGRFAARPPLTRACSASDIAGPALTLLDAREPARFRGEVEPIDRVAGHIPGARSAPFAENLADGRFKSREALAARFRALGVDPAIDTVCYCGSGVTAAHNILALLRAGYPEPVLYPGSWSEWIADPTRPIATGAS